MHIDSDRDWTDKDTYAKLLIKHIKDWKKYKNECGGTFFNTDFGLLYIYETPYTPFHYGYTTYKYIKPNRLTMEDSSIMLDIIMHPHRSK